jgi:ATP-dependent DNA ligase
MLARLAAEIPRGAYSYEPKWDGFRCIAVVSRGQVELYSRHGRPLARYFPELSPALAALPRDAVLDGELVVVGPSGFDFSALLVRVHPSSSRVARLARETPARLFAFDLLSEAGSDLQALPHRERRRRLEALLAAAPPQVRLTPATRDLKVARGWLDLPPGHGIDGVVAKADDLTYQPGKRAMVKVKRMRTADCVVAGMRVFPDSHVVASLLLGLYSGPELRHVGVASSFTEAERTALHRALRSRVTRLEGHPWEHGFNLGPGPAGRLAGSAGRWDPRTTELDWTPLVPDGVCEVCYDQLDGQRFRHPARLLRWRPDRTAASCTFDQLEGGAPDLSAVLERR